MSSNLVKSYFTTKETSVPRVIDNNVAVEAVIERIRIESMPNTESGDAQEYEWENFGDGSEQLTSEFAQGLDAQALEALTGEGDSAEAMTVIKAQIAKDAENMREKMLAELEAERNKLIEKTNSEVTMMKNLASEEIARDKAIALEAAKREGYEIGIRQAEEELAKGKADLELVRKRLEEEYEDKMFDLEPQFVRHITNIYEKVFQIELSDKKDIVLNILRNAMQKVEGTKNYIIHVSREDYSFVNENKEVLIQASLSADVIVDVVEDMTMKQGDCMIETANGIFDCGIDTQLSAIKKRLTLLSYEGRD